MFWKRCLLGAALAVMSLQAGAAAPQAKTPTPDFTASCWAALK